MINDNTSCQRCRTKSQKNEEIAEEEGRNLVVSVDGTSHQFGRMNTNVIELCSRLVQDKKQLCYYASGVGTVATPSWRSYSYWKQCLYNLIDHAIAWNFEKGVQHAYRWLAENYQEGDRIYLFGYSRGAYQVRTLAAMIDRVGLLRKGNQEQVAFAYEIYRNDGPADIDETKSEIPSASHISESAMRRNIQAIFILLLNLVVLGSMFFRWCNWSVLPTSEREYDDFQSYEDHCNINKVSWRAFSSEARLCHLSMFCRILFVWFRLYRLATRGFGNVKLMIKDFDSKYRRVTYPQTWVEHFSKSLWDASVQLGLFSEELGPERDNKDAARFKRTFSRKDVRIHFLGVWDTVSSIGLFRGKDLPGTSEDLDHVCYFRQALALDERRIKFTAEYALGAAQREQKAHQSEEYQLRPHIKEVWFPGTHSDIGGGNVYNADPSQRHPAFLWMCSEAKSAGLVVESDDMEWNWGQFEVIPESMTWGWKALELLPLKRPSFTKMGFNTHYDGVLKLGKSRKDWISECCSFLLFHALSFIQPDPDYTYWPHRGQGREILPGQKIHISVAFCPPRYSPKALLPSTFMKPWEFLVNTGYKSRHRGSVFDDDWSAGIMEKDIFDLSLAEMIVDNISSGGSDTLVWVHRLSRMTRVWWGCHILSQVSDVTARLLMRVQSLEVKCQAAVVDAISAIEQGGQSDKHLDYLQVIKELSKNADFLQSLLCDGNVSEGKFSSLRDMLGNDDDLRLWILQKTTLRCLLAKLKDRKPAARKSASVVLVGLGVHEDVQHAILGCDEFRSFDESLAVGIDWPLLPVVAGLANSRAGRISRPALVLSIIEKLRECMRSGLATNVEIGLSISAIAELVHHESVLLAIVDELNPAFGHCLLHLLEDEDTEFHQAAIDIIESLTTFENKRSKASELLIPLLIDLFKSAKDPVPALIIISSLTKYDICQKKVLDTDFVQVFRRQLSVQNGSVLRDMCIIAEALTGHENVRSRLINADFTTSSILRLQDDHPFIRFCAVKLLMISIQHYETHLNLSDAVVLSFQQILKDKVPYICIEAINTVSTLAKHENTHVKLLLSFLPCLGGLLEHEDSKVRIKTVEAVIELAKHQDTRVEVLDSSQPYIAGLLKDTDDRVRHLTASVVTQAAILPTKASNVASDQ